MSIFKNKVGRPSNETLLKRRIVVAFIVVFVFVIIGVIGLLTNSKISDLKASAQTCKSIKNKSKCQGKIVGGYKCIWRQNACYNGFAQLFTVKFNSNGGTGTMNLQKIKYGVSTKLNGNKFSKKGYVFDSWVARKDDNGKKLYFGCKSKGKCTSQNAKWLEKTKIKSYYKYKNNQNVAKTAEPNKYVTMIAQWTKAKTITKTSPFAKKFIYYSQKDYDNIEYCGRKNSTIASSGCGITSMAMVLANLASSKIDPIYTMKEAHQNGYCGYFSDGTPIDGLRTKYFKYAANKYKINYVEFTPDKKGASNVVKLLKKGGLVIAHVGKKSPFTSLGHYIVIRYVDANGKVYVADPNHKELYNTPYNINDFIDKSWLESNDWVGFYK